MKAPGLLLGVLACATGAPASSSTTEPPQAAEAGDNVIVIRETTEGRLGGTNVGVSNIWKRPYTLPDGTEREGITAKLSMAEVSLVVGEGSVVEVAGGRFEVVGIDKTPGERGRVSFRPVDE